MPIYSYHKIQRESPLSSTVINRDWSFNSHSSTPTITGRNLANMKQEEELLNYPRGLVEQFVRFGFDYKGVKLRLSSLSQEAHTNFWIEEPFEFHLQHAWLEAYLQYFNKTDATVNKGVEILRKREKLSQKAPVAVEEGSRTKDKRWKRKKRTAALYSINTEDPTRGGSDYAESCNQLIILTAPQLPPGFIYRAGQYLVPATLIPIPLNDVAMTHMSLSSKMEQ